MPSRMTPASGAPSSAMNSAMPVKNNPETSGAMARAAAPVPAVKAPAPTKIERKAAMTQD